MTKITLEYKVRPNALSLGGCKKMNVIFENFFAVVNEYCKYEDGEDAPYWYNERTTVGIFSGAIWRSTERSLEEFSTTKFDENNKEKNGRADLWFSCSNENFICEVKQYFKSTSYSVAKMMEASIADTKKTMKNFPNSKPLALTFWTPRIQPSDVEEELKTIHDKLKDALKEESIDMYCLVAPKSARNMQASAPHVFPCVILLGKLI